MKRKKVQSFGVGLGKLLLTIGGIWYKRTVEARETELMARQAVEDLDIATRRAQQIEAQTRGIDARTTRTIQATRVDIDKRAKVMLDIEKMELQILMLKRELGIYESDQEFKANDYQP